MPAIEERVARYHMHSTGGGTHQARTHRSRRHRLQTQALAVLARAASRATSYTAICSAHGHLVLSIVRIRAVFTATVRPSAWYTRVGSNSKYFAKEASRGPSFLKDFAGKRTGQSAQARVERPSKVGFFVVWGQKRVAGSHEEVGNRCMGVRVMWLRAAAREGASGSDDEGEDIAV
ncbi:hypothetical protein FB451DRAFT_1177011 [Mycena latifolia]|nr:hypothetical protein FB451DRAFT_1177011 [Mycena latifolia]